MPVRYTWSSVSDMVEMDRSKASHLSSTMAGLLCVCVLDSTTCWVGCDDGESGMRQRTKCRRSRRIGVEAALCPLWSYSFKGGCVEQMEDCRKAKKSKGLKLATTLLAELSL
jgi:hypothetical protein